MSEFCKGCEELRKRLDLHDEYARMHELRLENLQSRLAETHRLVELLLEKEERKEEELQEGRMACLREVKHPSCLS